MKKLITLIILCIVFVSSINTASAASSSGRSIWVFVNGENVSLNKQPLMKNNRILVPARDVLQKMNVGFEWNSSNGTIKVSKGDTVVDVKIGDKNYMVNDVAKTMDVAPFIVNGSAMIPLRFVAEAFETNVIWDGKSSIVSIGTDGRDASISRGDINSRFTVVVDAGHGGKEPGAIYGGVKEKDLNLDIAKRLDSLLKEQGIKTYMTRTNDAYVSLYDRSALANSVKADLLISVHNNAGSSRTTGSMSLYYPGSGNSRGNLSARSFAQIVQDALTGGLGTPNLGVISRPYLAVLRTADMPAVIAEVGYMTNSTELGKLKTSSFRQKSAEALRNAVLEALNKI